MSPFRSSSQMKWCYANDMPFCKEWQSKTGNAKKLPKHVKKSKNK